MWKELQKNPPFFLMLTQNRKYHILVTDYIKLWEVHYSNDELITRLKESNFGLEMESSELLNKGLQMLQKPSELRNLKIAIDEQKLTVSMTKLFGFPLKFTVYLEEGSQELFFKNVMQPALKTIQDLRCSEQELRKLLITKDDEIEEYKSFGGKIRYTAIPPYNDDVHMKTHCNYSLTFGDTEIPPSVLEKIVDIPTENHIIKEEIVDTKISVKSEPASQEPAAPSIGNIINNIKKERVKNEMPGRKRKLNI